MHFEADCRAGEAEKPVEQIDLESNDPANSIRREDRSIAVAMGRN